MRRKIPVRVMLLAWGCGSFAAGVVVSGLSLILNAPQSLPLGVALTSLGVVIAVAGVIGLLAYGVPPKQSS